MISTQRKFTFPTKGHPLPNPLMRIRRFLRGHDITPETYGVFCGFHGNASGATYYLTDDRKRSISFDHLEKKNGTTETLVTIRKP